jgi:lysozyme
MSKVLSNAMDRAMEQEGFRSHLYQCPAGYNTIGYGLNLDEGITRKEAEKLLEIRLRQLFMTLNNSFSYFKELPDPVKEVLLDMAYNMGFPKLLGFKKMWAALAKNDFLTASNEILDSKYHKDFVAWAGGNIEITRSFKNAERVRSCQYVATKKA